MKNVDDVTSPFEGTWRKPNPRDVAKRPRITWTSTIILNCNVLSTAKFLEHSNNQQTLIFLPQKWVHTFAKDDYPSANIEKIREIPHWLDEENVGCPFFLLK